MNSIFNFVNEAGKRISDKGEVNMEINFDCKGFEKALRESMKLMEETKAKKYIVRALDKNINYDDALYVAGDTLCITDDKTMNEYEISFDDIQFYEIVNEESNHMFIRIKTEDLAVIISSVEGFGLSTVIELDNEEVVETVEELKEEISELEDIIEMLKNKITKYDKFVETQDEIISLQREMLKNNERVISILGNKVR